MSHSCAGLAVLLVGLLVLPGCSKDEATGPTAQNGAPSVPTNPIPADSATAQPLALTLRWDVCADPENDTVTYDVYFGTLQNPPLAASNLAGTSYEPGGILAGATHFWRVVAKDNRSGSTTGPLWNFTTAAVAPSVPVLLSPANNDTGVAVPPTLSWRACPGATEYWVHVYNFSSSVYRQLTDTSLQVSGLERGTTYSWEVRASNTYGNSGWSTPAWQFRTVASCPPSVVHAGKTYSTVRIGTQCWFRENLDIGTMVPGSQNQANNGTIEKYCYNDSPVNCDTYGGLYHWDEVMQYDTAQGSQGICPPGWHIPTNAEFVTLRATVGNDGNALKRADQGSGAGRGTNTSGFSALLAGTHESGGSFIGLGVGGVLWSSTQHATERADFLSLDGNDANVSLGHIINTTGLSIRCLED